jgi:hypothetical protein
MNINGIKHGMYRFANKRGLNACGKLKASQKEDSRLSAALKQANSKEELKMVADQINCFKTDLGHSIVIIAAQSIKNLFRAKK